MHPYSLEILQRFPEITKCKYESDEDLPYLMAANLVGWMISVAKPRMDVATIRRIVYFHQWCKAQPAGNNADDDIMTIHVVGFLEPVFENDALLPLIPHLMTRQELILGHDYWIAWIGQNRYDAALKLLPYEHQARKKRR